MRASELAAELLKVAKEHGDPVVYVHDTGCGCCAGSPEPTGGVDLQTVDWSGDVQGWVLT
jgi:uncharacterized protein (DUF779 family)